MNVKKVALAKIRGPWPKGLRFRIRRSHKRGVKGGLISGHYTIIDDSPNRRFVGVRARTGWTQGVSVEYLDGMLGNGLEVIQ